MYSEELFSSVLYGRVQYMTNEQKQKIYQLKNAGKNITEISRELDISRNTIKSYLRRNNDESYCPVCGMVLFHQPHKKKKKFCSDKCRMTYWRNNNTKTDTMIPIICAGCGKKFYAYKSKNRKYCSALCYRGRSDDEK